MVVIETLLYGRHHDHDRYNFTWFYKDFNYSLFKNTYREECKYVLFEFVKLSHKVRRVLIK